MAAAIYRYKHSGQHPFPSLTNRACVLRYVDRTNGLQAVVSVRHPDRKVYVVFRGSNEVKDWFHNLMRLRKDIGSGRKIHTGYYQQLMRSGAYEELANSLLDASKRNPTYDLIITGHSAGGALATVFSYFVSTLFPWKNIAVVTFASPRVGNRAFRDAYMETSNLSHTRVVNQRDVITSLPWFGYHHVGEPVHIRKNGVVTRPPSNQHWFYRTPLYLWSVRDHLCSKYHENLSLAMSIENKHKRRNERERRSFDIEI